MSPLVDRDLFDQTRPYADTLIKVDERKSKVRIFGLVVIIYYDHAYCYDW